ncbi:MAG: hypothetical protein ACI841_002626, partial [Planctomycetota bacterium]
MWISKATLACCGSIGRSVTPGKDQVAEMFESMPRECRITAWHCAPMSSP